MFFSEKKIVYLNVYDKEKKEDSAGFAKCLKERTGYRLEIYLRKLREWPEGHYRVFLEGNEKEIPLGYVDIKYGEGCAELFISVEGKYLKTEDCEEEINHFYGLIIRGDGEKTIRGRWGVPEKSVKAMEVQKAETVSKQEWVENYADNKWQQLLKIYPKVHPFGDEREFISIEPKDFIVLQSSYQRLVNNSFLLHGFYNYRHIILGFCSGLGTGEGCYLGVPGNFYDREKMVAVMFGFEGFECDGPVENGKFGYYMRKVEL